MIPLALILAYLFAVALIACGYHFSGWFLDEEVPWPLSFLIAAGIIVCAIIPMPWWLQLFLPLIFATTLLHLATQCGVWKGLGMAIFANILIGGISILFG